MRDSIRLVVGPLAAAVWLGVAAPVSAQSVTYTGSVQVSTGDYIFTDRTTSLYFVSGLELAAGPVRVSGTVPVIGQSTPWVTYGPTVVPSGGAAGGEVARQVGGRRAGGARGRTIVTLPVPEEGVGYSTGLGDPLVRADLELMTDRGSRPSLRINASTKVPVAEMDGGFGTGAWDVGGGLSLAKRLGRGSLFMDVSYWDFGDLPDLELQNALAYGLAYGRVLGSGRWSVLTSISSWTSIVDGADPPVQLGVGLSRLFSTGRSVSVTAGVGLTETAPDVSIALGWRLDL